MVLKRTETHETFHIIDARLFSKYCSCPNSVFFAEWDIKCLIRTLRGNICNAFYNEFSIKLFTVQWTVFAKALARMNIATDSLAWHEKCAFVFLPRCGNWIFCRLQICVYMKLWIMNKIPFWWQYILRSVPLNLIVQLVEYWFDIHSSRHEYNIF